MILRKLFPVLSLSTLAFGLLLTSPAPAQAAEVMCSNDLGSCTVSNDGQSFVSCSCIDNSTDEGSGGDEFAGLSEEELNVICLEHLAWCEPQMGEGGEGTSTSDSGEGSTGDGDGDSGTSTSDSGEGSTGDGDGDSGTSTSDSGEGTTTGDTAEGTTTGDTAEGTTTGDTAEGTTSEGGDTGDGDGDSGSGSGSDSGGSQSEGGDGGSETGTGGDSGAGGDGDGGGCAVTTHASGFGLLMLSMLGLLGLRRRDD